MSKGIVYVATGEDFINESIESAKSIRDVMPNINITIFSDKNISTSVFDTVNLVKNPSYDFGDKVNALAKTPYEKTLFLDTDIYVTNDINPLFDLLEKFDLGAALNHGGITSEKKSIESIPKTFPEYNTGVLLYERNKNSLNFLKEWERKYNKRQPHDPHDQPSFRITLYNTNIHFTTLTSEYNCMIRYPGHVRNDVKIAHSRLLDIESPGASKTVNVEKGINKINKFVGHRLYIPNGDSGVKIKYGNLPKDAPMIDKFINQLKMKGIKHTLKNGAPYLIYKLKLWLK